MAVPTFDGLLLPFLLVLYERGQLRSRGVKEAMAARLGLSEEDRRELLPSGRQRRFDNRVGWASTYLSKAGLTESVSRGVFELSAEGRELVETAPGRVDLTTLRRNAAYRDWEELSRSRASTPTTRVEPSDDGTTTPEEAITENHRLLRNALPEELASTLQNVSRQRFEVIVVHVLLQLGYGGAREDAGRSFRSSHDGGVDGVIDEDRLGFSKIFVQAKRYAPYRTVGRPDVQAFV